MKTFTNNQNLNKAIDNAFIVMRNGTKHKGQFTHNVLVRPVTITDLFQVLAHQGIQKTMHECHIMMCRQFASGYVNNHKSEVHLKVTKGGADIIFSHSEHLNISLNRARLNDMFQWLADEEVFTTDLSAAKFHSEDYYK